VSGCGSAGARETVRTSAATTLTPRRRVPAAGKAVSARAFSCLCITADPGRIPSQQAIAYLFPTSDTFLPRGHERPHSSPAPVHAWHARIRTPSRPGKHPLPKSSMTSMAQCAGLRETKPATRRGGVAGDDRLIDYVALRDSFRPSTPQRPQSPGSAANRQFVCRAVSGLACCSDTTRAAFRTLSVQKSVGGPNRPTSVKHNG
jgi:hypothetical protein